MLKALIRRQIDAAEKSLGVSMDYLRHVLAGSTADVFRLNKLSKLLAERKVLPAEPFHVARLVAVMAEDCGECVQIEVNLAARDGVPGSILQSVIDMRPSDLPDELGDVYLFAECITQNSGDVETLRAKMRSRYGERGVFELSLAIALARTFPIIKRGMGYAQVCDRKGIRIPNTAAPASE